VLVEKFRVIVPDLRGYGGTEKPASGYDKRTMANDIGALLQHLDRGARVATRFAKDHPASSIGLSPWTTFRRASFFTAWMRRWRADIGSLFSIMSLIFRKRSSAEERNYGPATYFPVGATIPSSFRAKKSRNMCGLILSLETWAELLMITELVLKTSSWMRRMKEF
jgi:pimeloyl-ACP methyl ester carboxylesterase